LTNYDVLICGSGPGGYVAAEEAAQRGKSVAVVERNKIGGACLNVGCIPSKSYLQHSHWLQTIERANAFGIKAGVEAIDFLKLLERKNSVVAKLQGGIQQLFKSNHIQYLEGEAEFISGTTFRLNNQEITGADVILATGSTPFIPPIKGLEKVDYLTTDSFFSMEEIPERLVIIGGGVIAVELAFAMKPLGTDVTIIEVAPDILMTEDPDARDIIKKKLKKMKINVEVKADVQEVTEGHVHTTTGKYAYDQLLVATGRRANIALAEAGNLKLTANKKFIAVNEYYQTSAPHIYAIGDVIGGYQLAHAASAEGRKAVRAITGQREVPVDPLAVLRCVYTDPEVASFGMSVAEAKAAGYDVIVNQLPFSINGRAIASGETDGFIKIISESKYQDILGVVIVGSDATEMIHSLLALKTAEGTLNELKGLIYAHPTLSELTGDVVQSLLI